MLLGWIQDGGGDLVALVSEILCCRSGMQAVPTRSACEVKHFLIQRTFCGTSNVLHLADEKGLRVNRAFQLIFVCELAFARELDCCLFGLNIDGF